MIEWFSTGAEAIATAKELDGAGLSLLWGCPLPGSYFPLPSCR